MPAAAAPQATKPGLSRSCHRHRPQAQKREIETLRAELRDANAKRTAAAQEAAGLVERLSGAERRVSELEAVRLELHQQVSTALGPGPGSSAASVLGSQACRLHRAGNQPASQPANPPAHPCPLAPAQVGNLEAQLQSKEKLIAQLKALASQHHSPYESPMHSLEHTGAQQNCPHRRPPALRPWPAGREPDCSCLTAAPAAPLPRCPSPQPTSPSGASPARPSSRRCSCAARR